MKQERRFADLQKIEVRKKEDGSSTLVGYPAVFNSMSVDLGGFKERIAPGAFSKTISEDDIRGLFNHDSNVILGRTSASTMRLSEDDTGLRMGIDLPDTQVASDLVTSMERGDITGGSFGFSLHLDGDTWDESEDFGLVRTLKSVRLYDVGPVVYPAYPDTDVSVAKRSLEHFLETKRDGAQKWRVEAAVRRMQLLDL